MEVESKVTENIRDRTKDLELIAKGESLVQERVRQEVEKVKNDLSGSAALIAAVLGILSANAMTYIEHLPLTGDYKYLWATLIGLFAGVALGERIMLVAFGILLGLKFAGSMAAT